MSIAKTLISLRNQAHLSQEDLASLLHINRMTYHYYETGRHQPPLETMYILADYYHVSMDSLYGRREMFSCPALNTQIFPASEPPVCQDKPAETAVRRFRFLRLSRDLRQEDIAAELGISRSAYSYYESGKRQPPASRLIRIADYYRVSIDWLCGRK